MKIGLLSVFLLLGVAVPGLAQPDNRLEQIFQRLDRNGDGRITRDEVPDAAVFRAADTNADGQVTPAELRRYLSQRMARRDPPRDELPAAIPEPERYRKARFCTPFRVLSRKTGAGSNPMCNRGLSRCRMGTPLSRSCMPKSVSSWPYCRRRSSNRIS